VTLLLLAIVAQSLPEGAEGVDLAYSRDGRAFAARARAKDGWVVITHMGTHGPYAWADAPVLGPGGRVAFAAKQDGRMTLVVDGKPGEVFDAVDAPAFSPDGTTVAYRARVGGRVLIVVGEKHGRLYEYVQGPPAWSPDGKTVAYAAEAESNRAVVVVGDEERGKGDYYDTSHASFSPDGRLVYRGRALVGWKEFAVVDGKRGPEFDSLGGPVWSADGKSLAYRARRGPRREEGAWCVVVDGKPGPDHEAVGDPVFGPDGAVAYAFRKDGRWRAGDGEPFDEIREIRPGPKLAYVARSGKEVFVVVDGKRSEPFDTAWGLAWGKSLAFAARRGGRALVVVDGKTVAEADDVSPPLWDGDACGFGTRMDRAIAWKTAK
jgi:hypothetical protein